ncbi:MAG: tetratricopeptide repeat protein [Deferrisomatales bacterium]|nr:tetratricopeptide repeat protein [Deferrisomatales bacterium]
MRGLSAHLAAGVRLVCAAALLGLAACAAAPPTAPLPGPESAVAPVASPKERRASLKAAEKAARERLRALAKRHAEDRELSALTGIGQRYQELLQRPGTPEERKPELLLRLAELAYREEEAALREVYESGAEPAAPPGQRYPQSRAFYTHLTEQYPDSPQALAAFYNLGYLLAEEGEDVLSAWAYQQVLERDPETPYADEIHMRLGEALFEEGVPEDAVAHYQAVIAGGRPEYVDKAYYKLGWCYYNLEDYGSAVAAFTQVLVRAESSLEDLEEETVGVLARSLLEWGGLERLQGYLAARPTGFSHGPRLYLLLGELHVESSRYADAVAVFSAGVAAYPTDAACLDMEQGIIRAFLTLRDQAGAMARRETWLGRYGPGSPWHARHGGGELAGRRDAMVEEGLRLAALYHHGGAQRGQGSLARALELYGQYRKQFGDDTEQGYELAFAQAQALGEAGRVADAAARYREVARHPGWSAHREDASYRRISALEVLYHDDPGVLDELAGAHEEYVVLNPASDLVPQVLFAEGELYFTAEVFPAARRVFARLVQEYPDDPRLGPALERIARCYFREQAYPDTEAASRRALAAPQDVETTERVRKLLAFSIFKQAETLEGAGDLAGASEQFFRLADELPREEAAPVALYRGAENLRRLGDEGGAARVYDRLAREYPGSEYGHSALVLSARIFASLGDWGEAARGYAAIYRADPQAEEAPEALFAAADAWRKAGRLAAAAQLYGEFVATYPAAPRVAEAWYREGLILQEQDRPDEAANRFRAAWGSAAEGDAGVYRALAVLALGRRSLEAFEAVPLRGDLEQALLHKEELLEAALGELTRAASLPFAETLTESLYRAGAAFEHMKVALLDSERPAGLTAEELEEYGFLLEEKAFPLEERAVGFYRRGVAAARDAGVHTSWVERMYGRLEELLPWAYQRQEVPVVAWALPSLTLPPAPEEASAAVLPPEPASPAFPAPLAAPQERP